MQAEPQHPKPGDPAISPAWTLLDTKIISLGGDVGSRPYGVVIAMKRQPDVKYVTWMYAVHEDNETITYAAGHYFQLFLVASLDYRTRISEYSHSGRKDEDVDS